MNRILIGLCLGCMSALLGASTTGAGQPPQAARLLREIRAGAQQVRSAAERLDTLAASANPQWSDYDRQWNEMKPSVEDMQRKLALLEAMQSSLTPAERTEMDQTKPLIAEIQNRTHQFLTLLDKPGVQTSDAKFKTYARSLRNEAGRLETIVPAS